MLLDWLHGDLHHWAIFCCTVASLGLVGAFWVALAAAGGKGVFAFLNGSRQPTVIVVNGGTYTPPPTRKVWGFARIYCLCAAVFSGGPMLTLLAMWLYVRTFAFFDWTDHNRWVFALPGVLFLLVAAGWWFVRRDRQREADQWSELRALPAVASYPPHVIPHVTPDMWPAVVTPGAGELNTPTVAPIWTAPTYEGNWAERP